MRTILSRLSCIGVIFALEIAASAATQTVNVVGFSFSPSAITINVGDTISFPNVGGGHTVSGYSPPSEPFCGGSPPAGGACSVTFQAAGLYKYRCVFHSSGSGENYSGMVGTVNVVAPNVPPNISITNPPNNKLFAALATVVIGISASDSNGSVASVQLLTNGVFAATNTSAPYGFTLSNLVAGNYTLRARATDNQALSATSAPVNIRVVARPTLTFSRPNFVCFDNCTNPPLSFSYPTVTGVNYVIEGSIVLTNFSPVVTNAGSGFTHSFTQTNPAPAQGFFRLRLE